MRTNNTQLENQFEFFSISYSINELEKFNFQDLMSHYVFGLNIIQKIDAIINMELYEVLNVSKKQVNYDKIYFSLKTISIKIAMDKINSCEVIEVNDTVMVMYNN
jgi:hypothetical protein